MGKNKGYMRNGLWPTSLGQDPLLTDLADMFADCCDATYYGCSLCPVFEKCLRLWDTISNQTINPIKPGQFDYYKGTFDKIKEGKKNGINKCRYCDKRIPDGRKFCNASHAASHRILVQGFTLKPLRSYNSARTKTQNPA